MIYWPWQSKIMTIFILNNSTHSSRVEPKDNIPIFIRVLLSKILLVVLLLNQRKYLISVCVHNWQFLLNHFYSLMKIYGCHH